MFGSVGAVDVVEAVGVVEVALEVVGVGLVDVELAGGVAAPAGGGVGSPVHPATMTTGAAASTTAYGLVVTVFIRAPFRRAHPCATVQKACHGRRVSAIRPQAKRVKIRGVRLSSHYSAGLRAADLRRRDDTPKRGPAPCVGGR